MKESIYPLLVFLSLSVGTSCLVHMRQEKMWRAACISSSISIVAFIAVGAIIQGFLDPFWPIALVIGGTMSFTISAVVGVIFRSVLKRRRSDVSDD